MSCTVQVANHRKAIGLLYAGVQTTANAGVPEDQAGLAAALITTSFQLGSALGLAVFSGIATSRTSHLLAARTPPPEALTAGFQRALLVSALCLVAAGAIALREAVAGPWWQIDVTGPQTAAEQQSAALRPARHKNLASAHHSETRKPEMTVKRIRIGKPRIRTSAPGLRTCLPTREIQMRSGPRRWPVPGRPAPAATAVNR